jgi:hypothetical protein
LVFKYRDEDKDARLGVNVSRYGPDRKRQALTTSAKGKLNPVIVI